MLEFNEKLRSMVAEKAMDAANIAAGAMIFGQFLSDRGFSIKLGLFGWAIWFGQMICGAVILGGRRR